jgi:hypothetical protein
MQRFEPFKGDFEKKKKLHFFIAPHCRPCLRHLYDFKIGEKGIYQEIFF